MDFHLYSSNVTSFITSCARDMHRITVLYFNKKFVGKLIILFGTVLYRKIKYLWWKTYVLYFAELHISFRSVFKAKHRLSVYFVTSFSPHFIAIRKKSGVLNLVSQFLISEDTIPSVSHVFSQTHLSNFFSKKADGMHFPPACYPNWIK